MVWSRLTCSYKGAPQLLPFGLGRCKGGREGQRGGDAEGGARSGSAKSGGVPLPGQQVQAAGEGPAPDPCQGRPQALSNAACWRHSWPRRRDSPGQLGRIWCQQRDNQQVRCMQTHMISLLRFSPKRLSAAMTSTYGRSVPTVVYPSASLQVLLAVIQGFHVIESIFSYAAPGLPRRSTHQRPQQTCSTALSLQAQLSAALQVHRSCRPRALRASSSAPSLPASRGDPHLKSLCRNHTSPASLVTSPARVYLACATVWPRVLVYTPRHVCTKQLALLSTHPRRLVRQYSRTCTCTRAVLGK